MATNFPTSLDNLTNPTGSSSLTSPDHAGQHADANDAIEALQAKVGVNGSAVTTSIDYKVGINTPTGCIMMYTLVSAPTGWLLCDGSAVSRTTYSGLFAVIGTTYGIGNGSTTFNLPNLLGRVPVGKSAAGTFSTIGNTGGAETHTLSATESGVASHSHGASSAATSHRHAATAGTNGVGIPYRATNPDSAGAAGWGAQLDGGASTGYWLSNQPTANESAHTHAITVNNATATSATSAHNNLQPYLVLSFIIKT